MLALVCLLLTTTVLGEKIIDFEIYDGTPANYTVGPLLSLGARDKKIILLKTHGGSEKNFTISPSGILKTKTVIDREAICPNKVECNMTLEAGILPAENFQSLTINLKIKDVNDNTPRFPVGSIKIKFSEAAEPGDYVSIPPASDPDSPRYSVQRYILRNALDRFHNKIFIHKLIKNKNVGLENLRIILNSRIDRELTASYTLQVLAIDGGDSRRTGTLKVNVIVEDANNHEPVFTRTVYQATVLENVTKNSAIVQVSANDMDSGENGRISYSWNSRTEQNYANTFRIDSKNGTIFPIVPLDFEDVQEYELYVLGTDGGSSPRFSQTKVIINLEDVNDNIPDVQIITLHDDRGYASVEENSKIGSFVAHVSITDQDYGDNGRVECSIDDNVPFKMKSGLEKQYQIVTTKRLNREEKSQYLITLKCKDFGKISNVADRLIDVRVLDLNDNSPKFQEFKDHRGKIIKKDQLQVAENASIGHVIARIRATDPDEGRNGSVIYTLKQIDRVSERLLEIDRRSGIIRVSKDLDREKYGRIRIKVKASDEGVVSRHTSIKLTVKILDVDDNLPKFGQGSYEKSVYENRPIGTFVVLVSANDYDVKDKEVQLRFSRPQDYQIFDMDESGRITTKQIFDREKRDSYTLIVIATSGPSHRKVQQSARVTVDIADENDNKPVCNMPMPSRDGTVFIARSSGIGTEVTKLHCEDEDIGENADLTYILLSGETDLFRLDPKNGLITVTGDLREASPEYPLDIKVTDNGKPKNFTNIHLKIKINDTQIGQVDSTPFFSNITLKVVIGVTCLVIVLVILLVVVILLRRRKPNDPIEKETPIKPETERMLFDKPSNGLTNTKQMNFSAELVHDHCMQPNTTVIDSRGCYGDENGAQGSWRLLAKCGINEGTPVKDNDGSSNDSGRGSDEGDQRTKLGGNLQTFRDWYPSKSNHVIYKRGKVDVQLERDDVPESNV